MALVTVIVIVIVIMVVVVIMSFLLLPRMPLTNTLPWIALPGHPSRMALDIIFQISTSSLLPAVLASDDGPMPSRTTSPVLCAILNTEARPCVRKDFLIHGHFGVQVFFFHIFDQVWKQAEELRSVLDISW